MTKEIFFYICPPSIFREVPDMYLDKEESKKIAPLD
jgi:hypothetical protein